MMSANERDLYFAIQQGQFAAKMANRVHLRLFRRITKMFHNRIGQIEGCYQFCACVFADVDGVSHVIGVAVRDQNRGTASAEPGELEAQVTCICSGVDDDGVRRAALLAHDVAIGADRPELVRVDDEAHRRSSLTAGLFT